MRRSGMEGRYIDTCGRESYSHPENFKSDTMEEKSLDLRKINRDYCSVGSRVVMEHISEIRNADRNFSSPDSGELIPSPNRSPEDGELLSPDSRRNKRKLSEPRKRSDFSIKRICQSPRGSVDSDSGCSEDIEKSRDAVITGHHIINPSPVDNRDAKQRTTPILKVPYPSLTNVPLFMPPPAQGFFPAKPFPVPQYFPGYPPIPQKAFSPGSHPRMPMETVSPPETVSSANNSRLDMSESDALNCDKIGGKKPRKNYKNMTRERRIEANARERTRVHTISAAFESLRRAVPSYSYNQKLSKLAILRIACSYILSLAKLADLDYSPDRSMPSFSECVDMCTHTIQTEGRARRRH